MAKPKPGAALAVASQAPAKRRANGTWAPGSSGLQGYDASRARRQLNNATIVGFHEAFKKYGRAALDKVAKQQPAVFLKLLVLLVPRELEVTHSGGVKGMSDDQLEAGIAALERLLARRDGNAAKVIEGTASPVLPQDDPKSDPG